MTIRTREQLKQDFEELADPRYRPDVYAASERIRQHLVAVEEAMTDVADELRLAAQHKSNPGSTNGTLIQQATRLNELARRVGVE